MSTIIVALFGVEGSGKDTIGDLLRDQYAFRKESYANPIKAMAKIAFPAFTDEDLYGHTSRRSTQYKQYPMGDSCLSCDSPLFDNTAGNKSCTQCHAEYPPYITPRIALRTLGTQWGRRLYKNVWIDGAVERIKAHEKSNEGFLSRVVITDGRFDNEQSRISQLGVTTVLLLRGLEESTEAHESEAELKTIPRERFQYVIDNRGSLEELPGLIDQMLKSTGIQL